MSVKKRNPLFVIIASFVTFFIYALYWFYSTRQELNELTKGTTSSVLWTIGLFVPLVNLYVIWRYCEDVETASKKARDKVVLFLAWIVFLPIGMYLVQEELNKFAK